MYLSSGLKTFLTGVNTSFGIGEYWYTRRVPFVFGRVAKTAMIVSSQPVPRKIKHSLWRFGDHRDGLRCVVLSSSASSSDTFSYSGVLSQCLILAIIQRRYLSKSKARCLKLLRETMKVEGPLNSIRKPRLSWCSRVTTFNMHGNSR